MMGELNVTDHPNTAVLQQGYSGATAVYDDQIKGYQGIGLMQS